VNYLKDLKEQLLKLASEFRKQLFSGEEATQTAKDDEKRVTLNSVNEYTSCLNVNFIIIQIKN
jgi:hypothetical protein